MHENCYDFDPEVEKQLAEMRAAHGNYKADRARRGLDRPTLVEVRAKASEVATREETEEESLRRQEDFRRDANAAWEPLRELARMETKDGKQPWMQKRVGQLRTSADFQRALYASGQWTNMHPDRILLHGLVADTVQNMLYWDRLDDADFGLEQMQGQIKGGGSLKSLLTEFKLALIKTGLFDGQEVKIVSP